MKRVSAFVASLAIVYMVGGQAYAGLEDGLVAHYPFNGNAEDVSGNGNHGTVFGATLTEDRFGKANSSYSFDGIDDYISIPYSSDFDFSQEKQISYGIWVNVNSLGNEHNVPLGHDAPCSYFAYSIDIYGDNHAKAQHVEAGIHTASDCWLLVVSPGRLTLNNWHQIFVTADEDNLRLYIDGEKVSEKPLGGSTWNNNNYITDTYIGAWGGLVALRQFLDGKVDDIRIYNRALSEDEVLSLFEYDSVCDADYNGDGVINRLDKRARKADIMEAARQEFRDWVENCWRPAKAE